MRFASRKDVAWLLLTVMVHVAGCARVSEFVAEHKPVSRSDKFTTQMSIGKIYEQKGQLPRARDLYVQLQDSRRGEEKSVVSHRLGIVYGRMGDLESAKTSFEEALASTTQKATVLNDYGYLLYLEGDYAASEQILREAAAVDPTDEKISNNLAMVIGQQGRMDESFALFRQTVGEAQANANVGFLHAARGEGSQATERYSRALSIDGDLKSAANALSQIAEMKQKVDARRPVQPENAAQETMLAATDGPLPPAAAEPEQIKVAKAPAPREPEVVQTSASQLDSKSILEAIRSLESRQVDADAAAMELTPLLNHADDYVRLYAARALLKIHRNTEAAAATLLAAMTHSQPEIRAFAANFFQDVEPKSEEVVTALHDAMYDTDVFVRLYAANAVGASDDSVAVLTETLGHADERARWLATLAMADFTPQQPPAITALARALSDKDARVRAGAATALGRIGHAAQPALAHLEAAKDDSEAEVQTAVREAIQKIQP